MDNSIASAIVGAVIAGVFGLAGFIANDSVTQRRVGQVTQEEHEHVRTLLRLEFAQNAELLQHLRDSVMLNLEGDTMESWLIQRLRLIAQPAPHWGTHVWFSLTSQLPGALSEQAILKLYEFYADLAKVTALQDIIRTKLPLLLEHNYHGWKVYQQQELAQHRAVQLRTAGFYGDVERFISETVEPFDVCCGILNTRTGMHNPIGEPDRPSQRPAGLFRVFQGRSHQHPLDQRPI